MPKLSKRKRLLQKRSRTDVEGDETAANFDAEDDDFSDDDQLGDEDRMVMQLNGNSRMPKIGAALSANIRDMEYLESARIEREKRKDPNFQRHRLVKAQQRKRELELEHDPSMKKKAGAGKTKGKGGGDFDDDDNNEEDVIDQLPVASFEQVASAAASGNNSSAAVAVSSASTRAMFSHPQLELCDNLVRALNGCGFTHLTLIQERVIPFALLDHDVLGQARTGQGKTLAFCVPVLQGIIKYYQQQQQQQHRGGGGGGAGKLSGCLALMIAPTKELAHQINLVLSKLTEQLGADKKDPLRVVSELVTGGTKVQEETRRLKQANIVVGTVGRVADHVARTRDWNLSSVMYFVLDEVDRMLGEGFREALDSIIAQLPMQNRQTLLFSATSGIVMQKDEENIRRLGLVNPLRPPPLLVSEKLDQPLFMRKQHQQEMRGQELDYIRLLPQLQKDAMISSSSAPSKNKTNQQHQQEQEQLKKKRPVFGGDDENDDDDDDDDAEGAEETEIQLQSDDRGDDDEQEQITNVPSTLNQYVQFVRTEDRLRALFVFMKRVAKAHKAIVFCSTVASAAFHCMMMGSVGFHDDVLMLHGKMKHRQRLAVFQAFREWETGVLFCTDVAARGLDIPRVGWVLQLDPPVVPREYIHRIGRTARAGAAGNSLIFLRPEERGFVDYMRRFDLQIQVMELQNKLPDIQHRLEHVVQVDPPVARAANQAYSATIGAYESHELKAYFDPTTLLLKDLATCFALGHVPLKGIKKMDVDEEFDDDGVGNSELDVDKLTVASRHQKSANVGGTSNKGNGEEADYVKGRFKSLHRRKMQAVAKYHREKTKKQWTDDGKFVGSAKPSTRVK